MKIKNIFKKSTKIVENTKIQKLGKDQLSQVIGGGDDAALARLKTTTKTQGDFNLS